DEDIEQTAAYTKHLLESEDDVQIIEHTSNPSPPPMEDKRPKADKNRDRIATLSSFRKESSSSDEEGQAYYAGGSEHSGQQMLGPSKKKDPNDIIQNLFNSAKEQGAKVVDASEQLPSQRPSFSGVGHKLGSDVNESSIIPDEQSNSQPPPVFLCLKMWRNGFSVDDGPLRAYEDPNSREFLESIKKGEIPRELIHGARGGEVNLNMEDHRHEDFVPPKKAVQAFSGKGFRLGAAAPEMVQISNQSEIRNEPSDIKIDETKPTTNVQVRLSDGSRLVLKLNLTHTIRDIRKHICSARPAYSSQPFILKTAFPNKELTEEDMTVEDAKLQNAVIVQTFK
ncbi:NSFL1 cofactor p47-like protein, partial [Dinothrombium tinctorium]